MPDFAEFIIISYAVTVIVMAWMAVASIRRKSKLEDEAERLKQAAPRRRTRRSEETQV